MHHTAPRLDAFGHSKSHRGAAAAAAAASDTSVAAVDNADAARALHPRASALQLYNTMARSRQPFTPRPGNGNRVSMYVCGVTVYDLSHVGHARVYVAFDVLYRLLTHLGYEVDYVRNFTDIDDKIIKRAAEEGEDPFSLSARYAQEFHKDMALLGVPATNARAEATDHVKDMVETIERIISNGHAYVAGADVFFDVQSLEGYGRLSKHQLDSSMEGAHQRVLCAISQPGICFKNS